MGGCDRVLVIAILRRALGSRRVGSGLDAHCSACGEMVSVGGFDDGSVGDHGGEAFVESGGTNAAGSAQFGERPWLAGVGENRGDALIDGFVPGGVFGLWIRLDRP